MKIRKVTANNHTRAFEARTHRDTLVMPYARVTPEPSGRDRIVHVCTDEDPGHLAELMTDNLTLEAQKRVEQSPLSMREIARRLKTSVPRLHRLLDQTNCGKSMQQLISLLAVLDCEVELNVRKRPGG